MPSTLAGFASAAPAGNTHAMANRLHTDEHAGGDPPIVLLHGLGVGGVSWQRVVPLLTPRHRVLVPDLPGFGRSPSLPAGVPYSVPALSDAVERELDERALDAPVIAGNSLGGWVALELARRGRASALALVAAAGLSSPPEIAWTVVLNEALRAGAKLLQPLWPRTDGEPLWPRIGRDLATSPGFEPTLAWMAANQPATGLDEVRCPALVVWGAGDPLLPVWHASRFAQAIPGARLRLVAGGHLAMLEAPQAVAEAVLDVAAGDGSLVAA